MLDRLLMVFRIHKSEGFGNIRVWLKISVRAVIGTGL